MTYLQWRGRLFVVSAGNADVSNIGLLDGYPQLHLDQRLGNPAHAVNALTVGAYTTKVRLPPDPDFETAAVIAPAGGISPSTTAGKRGDAIKPDVVLEGGNIALVGAPRSAVASRRRRRCAEPRHLTTGTTGKRRTWVAIDDGGDVALVLDLGAT